MTLIFVSVEPNTLDQTSLMPANAKIVWHSFSTFNPVPFGAGTSVIRAEPHLPSTLNGRVVGVWVASSHDPFPRAILNRLSFAFLMAFSRAGTVSLLLPN